MRPPLRHLPPEDEAAHRAALVEVGRIAYERGLLMASDGNLSCRLAGDRLLITPSGLCKGRLQPDDLLVIDLEGRVLEAPPGARPSTETPMHLEAYRQRPDVRAVIHAHPPFATALTVAGRELPADVLAEIPMTLGRVPLTDFALPGSAEDAAAIRPFIRDHDAVLLRNHGCLTVGHDLETALFHLERLEHAARVVLLAELLGRVERLPPDLLARIPPPMRP